MIHQAGVSVTTKRGAFGGHAGTAITISGLAASAIPPEPKRSALTFAGGVVAVVGGVVCIGGAVPFGLPVLAAGVAGAVYGKRKDRTNYATAVDLWERTWCCRSCGTRWERPKAVQMRHE